MRLPKQSKGAFINTSHISALVTPTRQVMQWVFTCKFIMAWHKTGPWKTWNTFHAPPAAPAEEETSWWPTGPHSGAEGQVWGPIWSTAPSSRKVWSCWSRSRGGNKDSQRTLSQGRAEGADLNQSGEGSGETSLQSSSIWGDQLLTQSDNDRTKGNCLKLKR